MNICGAYRCKILIRKYSVNQSQTYNDDGQKKEEAVFVKIKKMNM